MYLHLVHFTLGVPKQEKLAIVYNNKIIVCSLVSQ